MGYIFRPGLHACDVAGSLVFLDLPADRYFLLAPSLNTACLRLCSGHDTDPTNQLAIHRLVDRDIVRSIDGAIRPTLCAPLACHTPTGRNRGIEATSSSVITALAQYAFAAVDLKCRSLDRVLNGIARSWLCKKRVLGVRSARDPAEVACAFMAADRLITLRGHCLVRSIAITRTMVARGVAPDLVLGVKLRPFEAHCWVQHDNMLISDDPGTVAPFTPILIV